MIVWIKVEGDVIVNALEYEQENFFPVDMGSSKIPDGLYQGFFRWIDGQFVFDQELYDAAMTAPSIDA